MNFFAVIFGWLTKANTRSDPAWEWDRQYAEGSDPGGSGHGKGPNQGPPDLDELWRDFNRKLSGMLGRGGGNRPPNPPEGSNGGFQPDMKTAGWGLGALVVALILIWLGSGFYIVQEGQQAVVTRFGKFKGASGGITGAGVNWNWPYPIERHEIVSVSEVQSVEVGSDSVAPSTGLRDSSMLTQDENIVDIRFVVQYRLKNSADFLFNNANPRQAVVQAAESAIREVVGKGTMNVVLNEKREAIAGDIVKSIQAQLDLYKTGILVSSVNIQNVQPPEQVQAAFDDALKAGQDGDRAKNEGQAYANDILPRAQGTASRLKQESEGYAASVEARAEGDAERFKSVLAEYKKAPQVTRQRMYTDAMQNVYSRTTKIVVDSKQGSNLLYLPLDKLLQPDASVAAAQDTATTNVSPSATSAAAAAVAVPAVVDARSRDSDRLRDSNGR